MAPNRRTDACIVANFGAYAIHNTHNVIALDIGIHRQISVPVRTQGIPKATRENQLSRVADLSMCPLEHIMASIDIFVAPEAHMLELAQVAEALREARREAGLSQDELAQRPGVTRSTVSRMENVAKADMSLAALLRLLEAAGYEVRVVKRGHQRTLDDVLAEQRAEPRS